MQKVVGINIVINVHNRKALKANRKRGSDNHMECAHTYMLDKHFDNEAEHNPLLDLLTSKLLDNLIYWILSFFLHIVKYEYSTS